MIVKSKGHMALQEVYRFSTALGFQILQCEVFCESHDCSPFCTYSSIDLSSIFPAMVLNLTLYTGYLLYHCQQQRRRRVCNPMYNGTNLFFVLITTLLEFHKQNPLRLSCVGIWTTIVLCSP